MLQRHIRMLGKAECTPPKVASQRHFRPMRNLPRLKKIWIRFFGAGFGSDFKVLRKSPRL